MVVGVIRLRLRMSHIHSLKEKRALIKGFITKTRNRFNIAVSEVAMHDSWQNAEIGMCAVGNSESVMNSLMDKVLDFAERTLLVDVMEPEIEIIHIGELV